MSSEDKQTVPVEKKTHPSLRSCFRFTLRTLLIVVLMAAFCGWLSFMAVEMGSDLLTEKDKQLVYQHTNDIVSGRIEIRGGSTVHYGGGGRRPDYSYITVVQDWYRYAIGQTLVHRDSVDLVMRQAEQLDFKEFRDQLPRIVEFSEDKDVILVYGVQDENSGGLYRYAFLLRDDVVRFCAEKTPTDKVWVEYGKGARTQYITHLPTLAKGIGVFVAMLAVMVTAVVLFFFVAFIRYLKAWYVYFSGGQRAKQGSAVPAKP